MNLVFTVVQIVAPVFVLAGFGYGWSRLGVAYPTEFVTRLCMTVAVPCLVFVALMEARLAPDALARLGLAALAAYAVVVAVAWAGVRASSLNRRSFAAPLSFGNTGNLGLPLALFAFGDAGLELAVVVFAAMSLFAFSVGLWMVSGASHPARVLREPMLWASGLGAVFLWQGWQTPVWMTNALSLFGQMAIPLMLITLGVAVARLSPGRMPLALALSLAKFGVCVVTALAVGWIFGLGELPLGVLVLQLATPVAVTSYLLAERYDTDPDAVAGLVVASTLLSMIALPITLSFLL